MAIPNDKKGATYNFESGSGITAATISSLPNPWTDTLPGSADNAYADLKQFEVPLPEGTSTEVIFDIVREVHKYAGGRLSLDGFLLDDLRVE
ncbi:MAG: hypothetical protein JXA30_01525 [Deltaproteobacteria bacterium]|nr:hypothetical protein [Deltaproteobacteria bacterium]